MKTEKILLDTHVWVWWATGDDRLRGTKALRILESSSPSDQVLLSVISIWEVGMLCAKNRLVLDPSPHQWVERALLETSVRVVPLSVRSALESTGLPGDFHGDPADRILVATAQGERAPLVTADNQIIRYCAHHHIPVIKV
jgi:PIN domain nuclease of toxin-antitoxin system